MAGLDEWEADGCRHLSVEPQNVRFGGMMLDDTWIDGDCFDGSGGYENRNGDGGDAVFCSEDGRGECFPL